MKIFLRMPALTLAASAVLLSGCGGQGGSNVAEAPLQRSAHDRNLKVSLDGRDGVQTLGILMAEARGYFAEMGIDVATYVPVVPTRPIAYLVGGTSDIVTSHQPQVVLARQKGAPITAVGKLVSQPTAAMIWLRKSDIEDVEDLRGKTIAIPGLPFQEDLLQRALASAGLTISDVQVMRVGYRLIPNLVSGRADAIFGGSRNVEGLELQALGLRPVITPVQDLGIPLYDEVVLAARTDFVSKESQLVRDFMQAVARGTAAALEDPRGAVEVIEKDVELNPNKSRKTTEAEVEATLPLLSHGAYMNPHQAAHLVEWMFEEGLIEDRPPVSDILTNSYLTKAAAP